ncbi:proteasome-type protease [Hyphomonas oceanitis]|uniref:Proteasome-type protease n=1 Tax=Hyphomonas oceanitis SCH89 TaxID=1280953 RepID=A0A059G460_9PROT|nr:proteasome-type protease [Hyphomonas oceanitis]KDA01504.1 proteasome-type protease [Hyphomonas oceanitis SCH89]
MTYCVALRLDEGLLFMSDTRTNAGVDNISTFKKMFTWSVEGDRVITIMTAGNLATTQAVISLLDERSVIPADRKQTLLAAPTMFQVARLVGDTLKEVIHSQAEGQQESESTFSATMIVGGQIRGMEPRLFLIYPEGNFIEASEETPFFQIGETKYGRPIILRAFDPSMSFEQAIKLLYVSFDSTLKANLAVGMPLDMHAYSIDTFETGIVSRIPPEDPYFKVISSGWGEALKEAFDKLPDFKF